MYRNRLRVVGFPLQGCLRSRDYQEPTSTRWLGCSIFNPLIRLLSGRRSKRAGGAQSISLWHRHDADALLSKGRTSETSGRRGNADHL